MREKLHAGRTRLLLCGITPAYAGKTSVDGPWQRAEQDHPRVCGKNKIITSKSRGRSGSPPRMREKPFQIAYLESSGRITPAYAGKTLKDPNEIKTFLSFQLRIYLLQLINDRLVQHLSKLYEELNPRFHMTLGQSAIDNYPRITSHQGKPNLFSLLLIN